MKSFLMRFSSKQLSIFLLTLSLILLFYVIYKERIVNEGAIFSYYFNYYVSIFLLVIFSLISFFIPKNFKVNLILVACSVTFALYLVEFFLIYQYTFEKYSREKFIKENNINFDRRTKKEVFLELRETDPDVTISISPAHFVNTRSLLGDSTIYPLSGISKSTTVLCNELGYMAIYESDRYGFKNSDKEWERKDNLEFVFVGDSFTQGACVNIEKDIPGNIRKFLRKNNKNPGVINFGFRGQGPIGEYALLREYLPELKTKRVVLIYFENDLGNFLDEYRQEFLLRYLKNDNYKQNLVLRNEEKDKFIRTLVEKQLEAEDKYQRSFFEKRIKKLIKLQNVRKVFFNTQPKVSEEYADVLKKTKTLIEQNNAKMYFVYLPSHKKYQKSLLGRTIWTKLRGPIENHSFDSYNDVINLVNSLGIPLIDLHEELFSSMEDPLSIAPLRSHGHFTEEGYYLVSKAIFDKINELENKN